MIIYSRSHNFIFVHLAKNGGTSISSHLRQLAEPGRQRTFLSDLTFRIPFAQNPKNIGFPAHRPAREIRAKLGAEIFDAAFSFAIVRNPFDRVVSRYAFIGQMPSHHLYNRVKKLNFDAFLRYQRLTDWRFSKTQLSDLSDRRGKILVSKIYKFENIANVLADVCCEINFRPPRRVPHLNSSVRTPYAEYYTPWSRALVERVFANDLDRFGYSF